MLAFSDDMHSTEDFCTLVAGMRPFLDLCTPQSRVPVAINIQTPDWHRPHPRCGEPRTIESYLRSDQADVIPRSYAAYGPMHALEPDAMAAKLDEALRLASDPEWDVIVRWSPILLHPVMQCPPSIPVTAFSDLGSRIPGTEPKAVNFVKIGQSKATRDPRTVWVIVYLCTPFDSPDAAFLSFWNQSNGLLPLPLSKAGWRSVTPGSKGELIDCDVAWPE